MHTLDHESLAVALVTRVTRRFHLISPEKVRSPLFLFIALDFMVFHFHCCSFTVRVVGC